MSLPTSSLITSLYLLAFFIVSAEPKCPKSFACGRHGSLQFPFSTEEKPDCGLFAISGCSNSSGPQRIKFGGAESHAYTVVNISSSHYRLKILSYDLENLIAQKSCFAFSNISLPASPFVSFHFSPNVTFFNCLDGGQPPVELQRYERHKCPEFTAYYSGEEVSEDSWEGKVPENCYVAQLPRKPEKQASNDVFGMLTAEFTLEWSVSDKCYSCYHGGGQCLANNRNTFKCKNGNGRWKLILAVALSGCVIALVLSLAIVSYKFWRQREKKNGYLRSSSRPSSRSNPREDTSSTFFAGIPIFSYSDLEKATDYFDPSKEVGDGGFGTVYYGKLEDGREVAIKRLYEHNYRRMEHFKNEIEIITGLRHPNLVSLYGCCTSRRSRELLLVYEYARNGTVADNLHGDRSKEARLKWETRMRIAVETATALAYLHKSDIVHRDVKTSNILLDGDFRVKVADFGLSRSFPSGASHVSTAPQGTPGYVDPEYHRCYRLTGKSDVYSFGVVLIELVSSLPAVDVTRQREEINLANLAVNRIQRRALGELIDPSLGYEEDDDVRRMTTCVAELAFRCLQTDKDLRPDMEEVLEFLLSVERGEENPGKGATSPEKDDAVLLKKRKGDSIASSADAVTDDASWVSSGSTTMSSIG